MKDGYWRDLWKRLDITKRDCITALILLGICLGFIGQGLLICVLLFHISGTSFFSDYVILPTGVTVSVLAALGEAMLALDYGDYRRHKRIERDKQKLRETTE
jgi:hypothetical protein